MRIQLVVSTLRGGGAERIAANLANAWAARDDEVQLVVLSSSSPQDYQMDPKVRLRELHLGNKSAGLLSAVMQNLTRIATLRQVTREFAPDVVLGIMAEANVLLALSRFGFRDARVGTEHNDPRQTTRNRFWRGARKLSYRYLDVVVLLNEKDRRLLTREVKVRTTAVLPNAIQWPIPTSAPEVQPSSFIPANTTLVLAVGRLEPVKGFDRLLRCFAHEFAGNPQYRLVILGEGPLRAELNSLAEQLGIGSQTAMPGRVGNIGQWYERADVFALSSHREGMPLALMEALASGTPSVGFACCESVVTMLRDGKRGRLIEADDLPGFRSALSDLCTDPVLRKVMGSRSREFLDEYSERRVLEKWDALFTATSARLSATVKRASE